MILFPSSDHISALIMHMIIHQHKVRSLRDSTLTKLIYQYIEVVPIRGLVVLWHVAQKADLAGAFSCDYPPVPKTHVPCPCGTTHVHFKQRCNSDLWAQKDPIIVL